MRRRAFEAAGSERFSRPAMYDMERRLLRHMNFCGGTFIEAGANDGFTQSNTYWLERYMGWRGVLIEPVPEKVVECRRNRPRAAVVNAALVAEERINEITITTAGLRAYVTGSFADPQYETYHRTVAAAEESITPRDVRVPAKTLASVIAMCGLNHIDLLSLDVEGYEPQVLLGMKPWRPRHILVELGDLNGIMAALGGCYRLLEHITPNDALLTLI
jgi:FkbM family methyltransferase